MKSQKPKPETPSVYSSHPYTHRDPHGTWMSLGRSVHWCAEKSRTSQRPTELCTSHILLVSCLFLVMWGRTQTHTHSHINTYTQTNAYTQTYKGIGMYTEGQTHTQRHIHIHRHTHSLTHHCLYNWGLWSSSAGNTDVAGPAVQCSDRRGHQGQVRMRSRVTDLPVSSLTQDSTLREMESFGGSRVFARTRLASVATPWDKGPCAGRNEWELRAELMENYS